MAYYDLISENDESTVVSEFEQGFFASEAPYMSERNLEDQFVAQLGMQEYDFLKNKGLVPVSHKNIIFPAFGKEQTAKGGVLYEDRMFSRWL